MKNKEIEELLNKMKKCYGVMDYYLVYNVVDLLLNHIKQLDVEYKEANASVTWWTNRYEAVVKQNYDKQKRINKAIEIYENDDYSTLADDMYKILKGDSDE